LRVAIFSLADAHIDRDGQITVLQYSASGPCYIRDTG